jgi:hypothetical protein
MIMFLAFRFAMISSNASPLRGSLVARKARQMTARFKAGDYVVYRKQKFSVHPGARAKDIRPAPFGDYYSYEVDKFWIVVAVEPSNEITVCTKRGKRLTLRADDPALRRAYWLERLLFRHRFPALQATEPPPSHKPPNEQRPNAD